MLNRRARLLSTTVLALGAFTVFSPSARADGPSPVVMDGNGQSGVAVLNPIAAPLLSATNTNVQAGPVTVGNESTQTIYQNYSTTGGAGAGGGAGLGGVFFVDQGASLSLHNVSFLNNTVTGGQGGGITVAAIGPSTIQIVSTSADASVTPLFRPGLTDVTLTPILDSLGHPTSDQTLSIKSFTELGNNALIASGEGVALSSTGKVVQTIDALTPDGVDTGGNPLTLVTLNGSVSLHDYTVSHPINIDGRVVVVDQTAHPSISVVQIQKGQTVYYLDSNDQVKTTTIDSVQIGSNGQVTGYITTDYINPFRHAGVATVVTTSILQSVDVTRFQASATPNDQSFTITPAGPIAGFSAGMTVTSTTGTVPAGTKVISVDPSTGVITLDHPIDLNAVLGIKGNDNPLISNIGGAVVKVNSIQGLAVGQIVSGTGIPVGTKIKSISGNTVTFDQSIGAVGVNAIATGLGTFANAPVISLVYDPIANVGTVKLASVGGFATDELLTGGVGVPAGAIITSIDTQLNTLTFMVDAARAGRIHGGSMNNLNPGSDVKPDGADGLVGPGYGAFLDNGEGQQGSNGKNGVEGGASYVPGGNGGVGGKGSPGVPSNPGLISDLAFQTANLFKDILKDEVDGLNPFTLPETIPDTLGLVIDSASLAFTIAKEVTWQIYEKQGLVALGGNGGAGGNGAQGSTFFGGGAGGTGGAGGNGPETVSIGGQGGQGGQGGSGGFGAGGGQGGAFGVPGLNGQFNSFGNSGIGGFGGGSGSTWVLTGGGDRPTAFSGGGGSGYGGAIFVRSGGSLLLTGNSVFRNNATYAGVSNNGGSAGQTAGTDMFIMKGSTVTVAPGVGNTITFNGSIADDSSASIGNASIASGSGASITIGGGGTVQLFGSDTYTGTTKITGATLEAQDGIGVNANSHIEFAGAGQHGALSFDNAGVLLSNGTFSRVVGNAANAVSWSGSGGFAALTDGLTVNLSGGNTLTWGSKSFVPTGSTLVFGSDAADATGTVTFQNAIDLAGGAHQIAVYHNSGSTTDGIKTFDAIVSGVLTNGDLTVNETGYAGSLLLSGQNSLRSIHINAGTVSTGSGASAGRLFDPTLGGDLMINTGVAVNLGGQELINSLIVEYGGSLMAAGPTTITQAVVSNGTMTFGPNALNANTMGSSGLINLLGNSTIGALFSQGSMVQMGTLNSNFVLNGGDWLMGADITASVTLANDGVMVVAGTMAGSPAVETPTTRTINTAGLYGTSFGDFQLGGRSGNVANTLVINQSGDEVYSGIFSGAGSLVKNGAGTLKLAGASTFTGPLTINGGTIDTTPGGTLAAAVAVTVNTGGTFMVGADDTIASLQNFGTTSINSVLGLKTLDNGVPDPVAASVTVTGTLNASGEVSNYLGTMTFAAGSKENLGATLYNSDMLNSQGTLAVTGLFTNDAAGIATFGPAGSAKFGSLGNNGVLNAKSAFDVSGEVFSGATGTITLNAGVGHVFGSLVNYGTIVTGDDLAILGAFTQNSGKLTENGVLSSGTLSGSGGSVVVNGAAGWTVHQTADATYSGAVSGSGRFSLTGGSTLTLDGAEGSFNPLYLTIGGGGITTATKNVLASSLDAYVGPGSTINFEADQAFGLIENLGTVNLSADIATSHDHVPYNILNYGTINVIGSRSGAGPTVTETAATRTIAALGFFGDAAATINLGGLSGTVANTLVLDLAHNSVFNGVISGSGSLVKAGAGTFNLYGTNTFTGPLTINGGTIDTTGGGTLASAVAVTVNSGGAFVVGTDDIIASIQNFGRTTINAVLGLQTLTNGLPDPVFAMVTVNGTLNASGAVANNLGTMTFATGSAENLGTTLYNADVLNSQGALAVTGAFTNDTTGMATLGAGGSSTFGSVRNSGVLTAASQFTAIGNVTNTGSGSIEFKAGSLPTLGSLSNGGTITIADLTQVSGAYIQNGGTLTVQSAGLLSTGSFSGTGGAVVLHHVFVTHQTEDGTYSGTVSGDGSMFQLGTATLTLAGAAGSFAPGELSLQGGAVTVRNAGILGSAVIVTVATDGTLNLLADQTTGYLDVFGTANLAADLTVTRSVGGYSALVYNTGTLNIIGTGSPEVAATRTINTGGFFGTGVTNLGGVSGMVANTLVLNMSDSSLYAGTFVGAGGLVKTGVGTLTATGTNTFTGALAINGGAFDTTGGGTLADGVDVTVGQAGTYGVGTSDTIHSVTNNGVTDANAALTLTTFVNTGTGTATISGTGALIASGDVVNSGALNFGAGSTGTIGGMLTNTGSGVMASQGALTVTGLFSNDTNATATLGSGGSDTFGSLLNAGTITANADLAVTGDATNSGTLTLDGAGNTVGSLTNQTGGTITATGYISSAGAVSNSGTIIVAGLRGTSLTNSTGAALADSGVALFSGAVSNSGTITTDGLTGTTLTNAAGATLTNTGAAAFSDAVVNAGTLATVGLVGATLTNSGTLNSTDMVMIGGAYIQNAGALSVAKNLFTGSLSGTGGTILLNSGSTFVIDQTAAGTFAGSIGGPGTVEKSGLANLTLSGPADSIATTTLNVMNGELIVTQAHALDRAIAVGVATGATVTLQANQVFGQLNGSGVVNFSSNNVTLTNGGNYDGAALGSGTFQLAGGTFRAGGSITAGALAIAGGTFDLAGTATAATTTVNNGATLQLGNGLASGTPGANGGTLNSPTVSVNGGATLAGNGTIAGSVTVGGTSAGTFAPGTMVAFDPPAPTPAVRLVHDAAASLMTGNTPGIMSVANLTFDAMATAAMTMDGKAGAAVAGGNSLVTISGNLVMNPGSTLAIEQSMPGPVLTLALGQRIQLFAFQPGHYSGYFGQVTASNFADNLIFDVPTGSVIALGKYTPAQFQTAVSQTPNQAALINALQVNTAGGVPQYYGGSLLASVTSALATGAPGAVDAAFERFSPEPYTGIMDEMKQSVLDNQLDLSSYDTLHDGLTYAIGNINRNGMDGTAMAGYAKNVFRDTAMQAGFAHQFSVAEVTLAFGHTDGSFHGKYLHATETGNQALLGVSVPIGLGQKLRVIGQLTYGGYSSHGDRAAVTGNTYFGGVTSHTVSYTAGLAYRSVGAVQIDISAKAIGLNGHTAGFVESAGTGTSANALDLLTIAPMNHQAWVGRFSAALGKSLAPNLSGYVDVTYDREMGRQYTAVTANVSAEAVRYTVENPGFGRDRALAGVGLKYDLTPSLRLHLDAKAGTNKAYDFGGGLRLSF